MEKGDLLIQALEKIDCKFNGLWKLEFRMDNLSRKKIET